MAGLKLQVLSNPGSGSGPSFIVGNPSGGRKRPRGDGRKRPKSRKRKHIAKRKKSGDTQEMSKRRRKTVRTHKRRRNPVTQVMKRGKTSHKVSFLTPAEKKRATRIVKYNIQELRVLRRQQEKARYHGLTGTVTRLGEKIKAKEKQIQGMRQSRASGRKHARTAVKMLRSLKRQGYRMSSHSRISEKQAMKLASKYGSSPIKRTHLGDGKFRVSFVTGDGKAISFVADKKGKPVSKKRRKSKKSSKKAAPRRKTRRKPGKRKARKTRKSGKRKARKSGKRRKSSKRKHARKSRKSSRKAPRRHRRKAKAKASPRKRKAHRSRKRKNPSGGRRRKNPVGGIMGKALDFLTAGDAKEAGFILAAAAVSEPLAAAALNVPGLGAVLSSINSALSGVSPNAAAAIVPILPNVLVAVACEAIGQKTGKQAVRDFGRALMITNIVDLGEAVGSMLTSMAGLSGVSYTPTMGRRHRGMRGVDFTRSSMGAIPRGMSAVPQGLRGLTSRDNADFGSYLPSPGGTLSTAADFGRQAADFGGVDFTRSMGAVPSGLRGAHTGDAQYPDPTMDADGNEDDTAESHDHCV